MSLLNPVNVVLADDHVMVREALARVLEVSGEINVVGQASNGTELQEVIQRERPDCLVMDYSMPEHQPIELIPQLLQKYPDLRILVLTVHENVHYAVRVLQAGAHGYLIKSAAVEELVDAIDSVRKGDVYISKKISPEVWTHLRQPAQKRKGVESLSQREFDVLRLLGSGVSLQQCASTLNIGVSTVSTYRGRILDKLNLETTSDLVRFAIENGLTAD